MSIPLYRPLATGCQTRIRGARKNLGHRVGRFLGWVNQAARIDVNRMVLDAPLTEAGQRSAAETLQRYDQRVTTASRRTPYRRPRFESDGAWKRSGTTAESPARELKLVLEYLERAGVWGVGASTRH